MTQWHVVSNNLNTHCSESLVRDVAEVSGISHDLGIKEGCAILKSMATRAAFLTDTSHKLLFHYTPKHASWLTQVDAVLRSTRRSSGWWTRASDNWHNPVRTGSDTRSNRDRSGGTQARRRAGRHCTAAC